MALSFVFCIKKRSAEIKIIKSEIKELKKHERISKEDWNKLIQEDTKISVRVQMVKNKNGATEK